MPGEWTLPIALVAMALAIYFRRALLQVAVFLGLIMIWRLSGPLPRS